jgi:hypothetical protein
MVMVLLPPLLGCVDDDDAMFSFLLSGAGRLAYLTSLREKEMNGRGMSSTKSFYSVSKTEEKVEK